MAAPFSPNPSAAPLRLPPWLVWVGGGVLGGVAYLLAARLGVALVDRPTRITAAWPGAGLSLAVLLRFGWRRTWAPLALFALIEAMLHKWGWFSVLGAAAGNALGPLLAARLVERFGGGARFLETPTTVFRFAFFGATLSGAVGASLGVAGRLLAGETAGNGVAFLWFFWFASDFIGTLLVTPPLIAWSTRPSPGRQPPARWLEGVALALACVAGAQFAFNGWPFSPSSYSLEYLSIPILLWAAFRFPSRGVTTVTTVLAAVAIANTLAGNGPFTALPGSQAGEALIYLHLFLSCISLMTLATAAVVGERRAHAVSLGSTVAQRTAEISASNDQLRLELAERRRMEQALRESRAMLRLVIDFIPQAVFWKDRDSVFLGCNRRCAQAAGLATPEEIVGKTDFDLPWTREQSAGYQAADRRVMESGRPEVRITERLLQADGTEVWLETSKLPLRDPEGRVVGILCTYEDITERRRIEQALQAAHDELELRVAERTAELARANAAVGESEQRLRLALEAGRMSVWRIDTRTDSLAWDSSRRGHGWTPGTLPETFTSFTRDVHPDDLPDALAHMDRCRAEGKPFVLQYRFFRRRDNSERWLETRGQPLLDAEGRSTIVTGVSMDITASKTVEEALRASEENYRALFELNPEPTWVYDHSTLAFLAVNQAAVERYGYSQEEFLAMTIADILPPEGAARLREYIAGHPDSSGQAGAWIHRRKDGSLIEVEISSGGLLFAGRRARLVVAEDVTARRAQEAHLRVHARQQAAVARFGQRALELGESSFESLLTEAADLVAEILGADFSTVFEHLPEQNLLIRRAVHGWPVDALNNPGAGALANASSGAGYALRTRQPAVSEDVREETRFQMSLYALSQGGLAEADVIIAQEVEGGGAGGTAPTPFGVLNVVYRQPRHFSKEDVDFLQAVANTLASAIARQRAQEAIQQAREEAERANAAKSEFLSRMSHELRTPLNAILGFGQLLELAELAEPHGQSVGYVLRAGRHLLGLIDEVLDLARIESGHLTLCPESIAVGPLLAEVASLLRPMAEERSVRLPASLSELDAHVLADGQRLKQVLLNLLSNAIKYNRTDGEVTLACHPAPGAAGRLRLEVRDTGQGMTPAEMGRLFTPFDRLGAESEGIEGTGIGLAISKRLVESMDGRITVASEPGVGSVFTVELPRAAPADEGEEEKAACCQLCSGDAETDAKAEEPERTVLYIEDNLPNLHLIEHIFARRPAGHRLRLLSAIQGGLGVDLARQHRPDLILLDLGLPDLSGEEVFDRLRADPLTREIPVLVLSADATARQVEKLLAAGAAGYITKPLELGSFLALLDKTLDAGVPVPVA